MIEFRMQSPTGVGHDLVVLPVKDTQFAVYADSLRIAFNPPITWKSSSNTRP